MVWESLSCREYQRNVAPQGGHSKGCPWQSPLVEDPPGRGQGGVASQTLSDCRIGVYGAGWGWEAALQACVSRVPAFSLRIERSHAVSEGLENLGDGKGGPWRASASGLGATFTAFFASGFP